MSIFTNVTRRPVTIFILFSVLLIFSFVIATDIPLNMEPDVEANFAVISTHYPGANAELIEDTITKPIERLINAVENIEEISSTTSEGTSTIYVSFAYKSGMADNIDNLRNALDMATSLLPEDAEKPMILKIAEGGYPMMMLNVGANRNHNELREYIDDVLVPYFDQINGVAYYTISGGVKKSVYIDISLNRLNAHNLTLGEVKKAILANGYGQTLGAIETKYKNVGVILDGEYKNITAIKNIIVSEKKINNNQSAYVRLRDIAEVSFSYGPEKRQVYLNGKPSVSIQLFKRNDSNIVEVSKNIMKMLKHLEGISPEDIDFSVTTDLSDFIGAILDTVSGATLSGAIIALFVLIIFLRNFASVVIVACSIPISIILTIMFMNLYGLTLNFMTLAGLAMGIGIIVDNSIVVLENIYIKRKNGISLLPAAEYGTAEMALPVLASTATTVLVFLPMIIFEKTLENIGAYFINLGFAVVVSVIISYFTAILLVPVLASKFIPLKINKKKGIVGKFTEASDRAFLAIEHGYAAIVKYIIIRRKRFILLIIAVAAAPILFFPRLGFEFLPGFAADAVQLKMQFPNGTLNEEIFRETMRFEQEVRPLFPPVKDTSIEIIGSGAVTSLFESTKNYSSELMIFFKDYMNPEDYALLLDAIIEKTEDYIYPITVSAFMGGPGFGGGYTLKIKSSDRNKLKQASETFTNILSELENFQNVTSNLPSSNLAVSIAVDRERTNAYGLTVRDVSDELSLAVSENSAGKYIQGSREYDIVMKLRDEDRKRIDLIDQLYIKTPAARLALTNLTENNVASTEPYILREDAINTIKISFRLAQGYTIDKAIADARAALANNPLTLDEDLTYFFAGEFEERNKNRNTMLIIFLFAILFVFGIMASMFESFSDPFIIIFTIPLTFSGVVLIYFLTNSTITSFSLAGLVILVGISVNHGIVLVDYINVLRKRGRNLVDAIVEGTSSRLQPILMTTLTTMGGMAPLAFTTRAGGEMIKPLALSLFGGLGTSALLSLFFVPLIYGSFHSLKQKFSQKRKARLSQRELEHEQEILDSIIMKQGDPQ